MELSLQSTFSWHSDFEANDTWSLAKGLNIANDTDLPIRTLQLGHHVQLQENVTFASNTAGWNVPTYENLKPFSAICYYFGRALYYQGGQKIPVGLIEAAWGGTIIEAWTPLEDQYLPPPTTDQYSCPDPYTGTGLIGSDLPY
jgi:sialate O-acetylesterase